MSGPTDSEVAAAQARADALEARIIEFIAQSGEAPEVSLAALIASAGWTVAWLVIEGKPRDKLLGSIALLLDERVETAIAALTDAEVVNEAMTTMAADEAEKETKH